jgi:hypothetical protein
VRGQNVMEEAVLDHRLANFDGEFQLKLPASIHIPYTVTRKESEQIEEFTRDVQYRQGAIVMLQKILAVLKWKLGPAKALSILEDLAPCFSQEGGQLLLEERKSKHERKH